MPFLSRITLHPIKSLDGVTVTQTRISRGGTLTHDRAYALVDTDGRFVNGKANAKVHSLRSVFDLEAQTVTLYRQGTDHKQSFHLDSDRPRLGAWLCEFFGCSVRCVQNSRTGFPDDLEAYGPTLVSTATLREVGTWFPGIDVESMRLRFRANLEIEDVPSFWEDRLFHEPGSVVEFSVGAVRFEGINPCQRCVVPSRDPRTGEPYPNFQKRLATRREQTLPSWAARSRFNHFYRLSVNTRIPGSESGKVIRIGEEIKVIGIRHL